MLSKCSAKADNPAIAGSILKVPIYYWCRNCKKAVHGWGENEILNAFIGPDVRAKISFMRHEVKTSYNGARLALLCLGNLDETGWKRDWLWTFTNPNIAFFHIDDSRGSKVVIDHLGEFYNGILISDFWSAYRNKIGAFAKQKCLRHIMGDIRDLLKDESLTSEAKMFLSDVKELFKDAILLHNMYPTLSNEEYRPACKDIRKRFKKLRSRPELEHHETDNIRKRLINFKDELLVFLKYPAIPPTNNPAEQGIRNAVLFRKISFGNMTERGKRNVSIIMTILRTAKLRALDPIKVLVAIMTNNASSTLLNRFLRRAMPEAP